MIERKIKFTLVRIIYEDKKNSICRAIIKVKEANIDSISNVVYTYIRLDLVKEYEAIFEENVDKDFRIKEIVEVYNVSSFVKEALASDRNISNQIKEHIMKEIGEEHIECLAGFSGEQMEAGILTQDKAEYITDKAKMYAELLGIREYFKSYGIQSIIADKVYKKFGENAIQIMQDNPYLLVSYEVCLKAVDKLANSLGISHDNNNRVKCGVLEWLKHRSNTYGHVFIIQEELINNINEYMNKNGGYSSNLIISQEKIIQAIGDLEKENEIITYINEDKNKCLYIKELYECEFGVAQIISNMMLDKVEISKDIIKKIDDFTNSYSDGKFKLTQQQIESVKNAIKERISILQGFPGAGKTKTLTATIQCIKYIYKNSKIEVVAFTGKAVSRIKEMLPEDVEAKTIHRLLGIGFNRKIVPISIDVDFLVIDEATLIDVRLFHCLLKSCVKNDTKILIIGDQDQISMGIGKIFCDLIRCHGIKKVKLTEIFRQSDESVILGNIKKMSKAIGLRDCNGLKCKKGEFEFIEAKGENEIQNKIEDVISRLIKEGKSLMDIQVLSSLKNGKCGTKELNKLIQDKFNYNPRRNKYNLVVGDKVMQNVNNSKKDIFNGDTGLILSCADDKISKKTVVRFSNGKLIEYVGDSSKEIESSYCITIHKSQGSQFPVIILPIAKEQKSMLNLNIIYTGCSRAQSQIIIIGDKDTFETALKTTQINKNSNLTEMIEIKGKDRLNRTA
ncbi:AAA family ATPase [Clostridium estertheticum]|uniref:AAA family ATPase n=1 Tax=Clostridium estertheticum TaxID=238834 RepID=A0A7Y3SZY6_9CLOT|nr:AAA family ATPase [Clostridium estertheticum]NNU78160.1 AAA family ATPase [Clostridium estertheticum]WBL47727.1 ATP-dependent RecD-like DNA helicase [Clostridium estertheticum]